MMYHKPHVKRSSKILEEKEKKTIPKSTQQNTKPISRPIVNRVPGSKNDMNQKVEKLQKIVKTLQTSSGNQNIQQLLMNQIKGIKSQLKQIKSQMGIRTFKKQQSQFNQQDKNYRDDEEPQEENIMNFNSNDDNHEQQCQEQYQLNQAYRQHQKPEYSKENNSRAKPIFKKQSKNIKKKLIDIGKIQPYMKQFKLLNTQNKTPLPFYHGYHKKSSKAVIVKYCEQDRNMDYIVGLYEKLWKNIVKAKYVCINRIYDLNQPLASNIIVIEENKCGLQQIQMSPFQVAKNVLRAIQFFHECGYLYRNIHPDHIMLNSQGHIVLIDLKRAKKFVNIKNNVMEVKGNLAEQQVHEFISNARITHTNQGRKDDLECLGYLTLYLLEGKLPWNQTNILKIRQKMVLNQIFGKYPNLLRYMIKVQKLAIQEAPDYNLLFDILDGKAQ